MAHPGQRRAVSGGESGAQGLGRVERYGPRPSRHPRMRFAVLHSEIQASTGLQGSEPDEGGADPARGGLQRRSLPTMENDRGSR